MNKNLVDTVKLSLTLLDKLILTSLYQNIEAVMGSSKIKKKELSEGLSLNKDWLSYSSVNTSEISSIKLIEIIEFIAGTSGEEIEVMMKRMLKQPMEISRLRREYFSAATESNGETIDIEMYLRNEEDYESNDEIFAYLSQALSQYNGSEEERMLLEKLEKTILTREENKNG